MDTERITWIVEQKAPYQAGGPLQFPELPPRLDLKTVPVMTPPPDQLWLIDDVPSYSAGERLKFSERSGAMKLPPSWDEAQP